MEGEAGSAAPSDEAIDEGLRDMIEEPGTGPPTIEARTAADDLDTVLEGLSGLLLEEAQVDDAIATVLDAGLRTLGGTDHAVSMTVSDVDDPDWSFSTRGATTAWARELDEWQYEHGEGPCLLADETGETCVVEDLLADDRFPDFAVAAAEHDVRSCVSYPMLVRGRSLGSINVFHREVGAITDHLVDAGEQLARASAPLLANWMVHRRVSRLAEQLQEALDGRAVIERAKGVLMAELGVDEDRAFELLRAQSNHEHRKVRDVAAGLLAERRDSSRHGGTPTAG